MSKEERRNELSDSNGSVLDVFREALEKIAGNESEVNAERADGIAISALAQEFETRDASACKHTFRPELTGIAKGTPSESGSFLRGLKVTYHTVRWDVGYVVARKMTIGGYYEGVDYLTRSSGPYEFSVRPDRAKMHRLKRSANKARGKFYPTERKEQS